MSGKDRCKPSQGRAWSLCFDWDRMCAVIGRRGCWLRSHHRCSGQPCSKHRPPASVSREAALRQRVASRLQSCHRRVGLRNLADVLLKGRVACGRHSGGRWRLCKKVTRAGVGLRGWRADKRRGLLDGLEPGRCRAEAGLSDDAGQSAVHGREREDARHADGWSRHPVRCQRIVPRCDGLLGWDPCAPSSSTARKQAPPTSIQRAADVGFLQHTRVPCSLSGTGVRSGTERQARGCVLNTGKQPSSAARRLLSHTCRLQMLLILRGYNQAQ